MNSQRYTVRHAVIALALAALIGCAGYDQRPAEPEPSPQKVPAQAGQVVTLFPTGSATSRFVGQDVSTVFRNLAGTAVLARIEWSTASGTFTWTVPGVGSHTGTNNRPGVPTLQGSNYAAAFLHDRVQLALGKVVLDEPGCDGVPDFFEGICVGECCEVHDACFARWDCSWSSWLPFVGSDQCDQCNDDVFTCIAMCFAPGGNGP